MTETSRFDRRAFLTSAATAGGALAVAPVLGRLAPVAASPAPAGFGIVRQGRPSIPNGVQSGDVTFDSAVVWSRANGPARMVVSVGSTEHRRDRIVRGPLVTDQTDYTGKIVLGGLRPGQRYTYRVQFVDGDDRVASEEVTGSFTTPTHRRADVRFAWTGDQAGQGWGINPEWGGMRCWETIRSTSPAFLLHSGDTVYADGPLQATVPLPDGSMWHNVVIPEKAKVAETQAEFWGNFRYNLLDDNVRRCNAEVPIVVQWDDHEVLNNWYPGEVVDYRAEYTEQNVDVLAARASRAFHDYFPIGRTAEDVGRVYRKIPYGPHLDVFVLDMRTFRGPNSADDQAAAGPATAFLGPAQVAWLLHELDRSHATWKVIAADMPLGLVVPDPEPSRRLIEAVAQGTPGAPLGRELEIAGLLAEMKRRRIRNTVWLTADVHYCAAHHYDPTNAGYTDFDPFWEFVAGPVHAGTFGPNALDPTFGPTVVFSKPAEYPNMAPSAGYQFFGLVDIDGRSGAMTVSLVDVAGTTLFSQELSPTPAFRHRGQGR